jgi:hypothetical protein
MPLLLISIISADFAISFGRLRVLLKEVKLMGQVFFKERKKGLTLALLLIERIVSEGFYQ